MATTDEDIFSFIKDRSTNYLGCQLYDIEERFTRGVNGLDKQGVWAALSRLAQSKRIKKSGSIRYKSYKAIAPQEVTTSW